VQDSPTSLVRLDCIALTPPNQPPTAQVWRWQGIRQVSLIFYVFLPLLFFVAKIRQNNQSAKNKVLKNINSIKRGIPRFTTQDTP
jgi:hypothetical protein